MDLVYKYYSVNGYSLANFRNNSVCFSDLQSFNDPFEGVGNHIYNATQKEIEFWNSIDSTILSDINVSNSQENKEMLRFKNRILCVTGKNDNHVMWAHYGGSHSGFCVGYAANDISSISNKFDRVRYEQQPPIVDIRAFDINQIEDLLYVKSEEWRYENEWRAIYKLDNNDLRRLNFGENFNKCSQEDIEKLYVPYGEISDGSLCVLEANKYILKECKPRALYLGLRMNQDNRNLLIDIAKRKGIDIYQMRQQPNSFKLEACLL